MPPVFFFLIERLPKSCQASNKLCMWFGNKWIVKRKSFMHPFAYGLGGGD